MLIFLVGFMGSGKSTFGKRLADKLNYNFIDLDDYIEAKYNTTIKEIFATKGQDYFREIEKENLLEIIKNENTVIAPGGGTPCYFDNMNIMNNAGFTVYIRQGTNCLHQRLNRSKKFRPLIENMKHFELVEYLETTMEIRAPFYRQAKITIAGKGLSTQKLERVIRKYNNDI